MPDMVKDGTGKGYLAQVDSDNHLHTAGNTRSRLSFVSRDKAGAYSIYGRRNFAASETDEGILFFEYVGSDFQRRYPFLISLVAQCII